MASRSPSPNGISYGSTPTPTTSVTNLVAVDKRQEANQNLSSTSLPLPQQQQQQQQYRMYPQRWIGLAAIFGLNVSTSFVWLTFNAVPDISAAWLHTGLTEVNLTVILYFIGYLVMSPFSGYAFEKFGLKKSLIIGGVLNIVGNCARYGSSFIEISPDNNLPRLVVLLAGQFIAAMSQPYFLSSPPKYAAVWFGDKSRATALTIGSMSNPIAAAACMVIVPIICEEESGDDLPMTLLIVLGMAVLAFIPALLMPAMPPTPPSPSAEQALAEMVAVPFWTSVKQTCRNKNFLILFGAFAISVGLFNMNSSLMNQIVTPYGYDDDTAGLFGGCLIVCGVVGAGISGVFIDKTKRYILVLRTCAPIASAAYIVFIFMVRKDNEVGLFLVTAVLGFFTFALLPVALELGIECTYPTPPSASIMLLWMGGQLSSVVFLVVGDELRDEDGDPPKNMKVTLIGSAVLAGCSTIIAYFYNSRNKRMEAELLAQTTQGQGVTQVEGVGQEIVVIVPVQNEVDEKVSFNHN